MSKEDVINYVMTTPNNPNRTVLEGMLDSIAEAGRVEISLVKLTKANKTISFESQGTAIKQVTNNASIFEFNDAWVSQGAPAKIGTIIGDKTIIGFCADFYHTSDKVSNAVCDVGAVAIASSPANPNTLDVIAHQSEQSVQNGSQVNFVATIQAYASEAVSVSGEIRVYAICISQGE
jgi:hypothetical protein